MKTLYEELGTDPYAWAKAFKKATNPVPALEIEWLAGWFANAMHSQVIHKPRLYKHLEQKLKSIKCDCGAEKARTTHSDWCSTNT